MTAKDQIDSMIFSKLGMVGIYHQKKSNNPVTNRTLSSLDKPEVTFMNCTDVNQE